MTDHTRPLWADLPHGDEITALLDELRTLSPDEARAMATAWEAAWDITDAAWDTALNAVVGAARITEWGAAWYAVRDAVGDAERGSVLALVVADLVGQYGLTIDHLRTLVAPARAVPRLTEIIDRTLAVTPPSAH